MIAISVASVSDHLSLEEAIIQLKSSPLVDGVAEFGSRATRHANVSSDYDLLVLVRALPAPVLQMVTTIGGRLADIVLVPIETADTLVVATEPPTARSFEALFAQKMRTAQIRYDASGRLHKVQQLVTQETWEDRASNSPGDTDLYAAWFWQGFGLLHLERMAQAHDPSHLSAVDLMLIACLSGTWRSYFEVRGIAWEGEKPAIRYWAEHDREYLGAVRKCLESQDRNEKLAAYRELVERTIEPIGKAFTQGETAVILAHSNNRVELQRTLHYWRSLFGP